MRYLITGAAGFIGGNLLKECITNAKKWDIESVVGVDIDSYMCNMQRVHLGLNENTIIPIDFASDRILEQIDSKKFDCVFHLAANPSVPFSVKYPRSTDLNNINKSVALLESCMSSETPIVFASSSSIYGDAQNVPTTENEKINPLSPYALQKATFEKYLNLYKDLNNFNSISLRFFNVYGPGQQGSSAYSNVLASWMFKIKNKQSLILEGDGEQRRDFCYVSDVVESCLIASKKVHSMHGAFNIGSGVNYSCNELLDYIKTKFSKDLISISNAPARQGDVRITLSDISLAKNKLSYSPKVNFWDGVDKTIDWWFC